MDLLTLGILVSIVCIVAVSVTGVMTYLTLQELITELNVTGLMRREMINNSGGNMGLKSGFKVTPRKKILKVLDHDDLIPALSLIVTYFDLFGFQILQRELKGIIERKTLNGLSTHVKIILLRVLNIIEESTYNDMLKIKARRNSMIHPKEGVMVHPTKKDIELMDRAFEIIEELINKI